MVADRNLVPFDLIEGQSLNMERLASVVPDGKIEHLIEVAIINQAVPADADKIATHDLV